MRKLSISLYDEEGIRLHQIISEHLDATPRQTILYHSFILNKTYSGCDMDEIHITKNIDHFYLMDGMITIYYEDHSYMEIARINND